MLRIKQAIDYYNLNRSQDSDRMTQTDLAEKVIPEKDKNTAGIYLSGWINGKRLSALKPEHVKRICQLTGVDANYLFNVEPMNSARNES